MSSASFPRPSCFLHLSPTAGSRFLAPVNAIRSRPLGAPLPVAAPAPRRAHTTAMSAAEKPVVLCPGQGAQVVGMGRAWIAKSQRAQAVLDKADKWWLAHGHSTKLSQLILEGPKERLDKTDIAQPAIFVTSIVCWEALNDLGFVASKPAASAGLSLGEYTALVVGNALQFEDALQLVTLRGKAMQDAAEKSEGTMVALLGASEEDAYKIVEATKGGDVLVAANFNAPGQVVLSGGKGACARAADFAKNEMKMKAIILDVAGAFHSPLMQPAADRLAEALNETAFSVPSIPVMSNVTGMPHNMDVNSIRTRLYDQLTQSVRWADDLIYLKDHKEVSGDGPWLELAPGKTLSGMVKKIDRKMSVLNFDEPPTESSE